MTPAQFRRRWIVPLVFFQGYLSVTVVLFFFGPWPWDVYNPGQLATYLVLAQISIAIGYLIAFRQGETLYRSAPDFARSVSRGIRYLKVALFVSIILVIPTSLSRTGAFIPDMLAGIQNVGAAYNENLERLEAGNPYVAVEYLRLILAPFLVAVFPLAVVYWAQLSRHIKLLCLFVIATNLSMYIATGTNKGIADTIVTLPWLLFLASSAGIFNLKISKAKIIIGITVLFIAFLQFFGLGQMQRAGGVGEFGIFNTGFGLIEAETAADVLSDNQRIIFESLSRYLSQGYFALSMTFDLDSHSTYGLGNSMFLARNADALFHTNYFTSQSLPGLLEADTGWGMFTLWHSIYPWLASDFGFAGALIVMGIFGYLLGLSWSISLVTLSPKWVVFTFLLLIMFFYIPANNQIFQSGESCFAFYLTGLALILANISRRLRRTTVSGHAAIAMRTAEEK